MPVFLQSIKLAFISLVIHLHSSPSFFFGLDHIFQREMELLHEIIADRSIRFQQSDQKSGRAHIRIALLLHVIQRMRIAFAQVSG